MTLNFLLWCIVFCFFGELCLTLFWIGPIQKKLTRLSNTNVKLWEELDELRQSIRLTDKWYMQLRQDFLDNQAFNEWAISELEKRCERQYEALEHHQNWYLHLKKKS
jgi:hypothetical protein